MFVCFMVNDYRPNIYSILFGDNEAVGSSIESFRFNYL